MAAPYTAQKDHVDFNKLGDTGQDNIDAIAPVSNGEAAVFTVFARPSENLRERTEDLRQFAEDTLYYRDAQHFSVASTGTITWGGTVADAGTGIVTPASSITLRPFLTPRADTKGTISVGTATVNQITYTVSSTGWSTERMNQVFIEHRDVTSSTATVSVSDGPVKRILVIFDSTNTGHYAAIIKGLVDSAIAADVDLVGKIVVTTNAVALVAIDPITSTRFEGTSEAEAHVISGADIVTLTTGTPLQDGDTVAIWYRYLIDPIPASYNGKRESTSTHGNTGIPLASLFITSLEPTKIPGAIPLCTVVGTKLIFVDGSVFNKGDAFLLGGASASSVYYNGGPAWADTSTNPATTVENQLDKIITDLGGSTTGTAKISGNALTAAGPGPGTDTIGSASLLTQLQNLLNLINKRADLKQTLAQTFAANVGATTITNGSPALGGIAQSPATDADALYGLALGTGAGVRAINNDVANGYGVYAVGHIAGSFTAVVGGAWGIVATGGTSFEGVQATGGPSDGTGLRADGGGTNGKGIFSQGQGTGHGVDSVAGSDVTAAGIKGRGGAFVNGTGVWGLASNNGAGVLADGGAFNGTGMVVSAGLTAGIGIDLFSNAEGINVLCTGSGSHNGINVLASAAGNGIAAVGGGTLGTTGVKGTGGAAGGVGVAGYGVGSGLTNVGVYGISDTGVGGVGVWGAAGAASQDGVLGAAFSSIDHTGCGVFATGCFFGPSFADGGYGLIASGSVTRSPLRLVPQAQPTHAQNGDMFYNAGLFVFDAGMWKTVTIT